MFPQTPNLRRLAQILADWHRLGRDDLRPWIHAIGYEPEDREGCSRYVVWAMPGRREQPHINVCLSSDKRHFWVICHAHLPNCWYMQTFPYCPGDGLSEVLADAVDHLIAKGDTPGNEGGEYVA